MHEQVDKTVLSPYTALISGEEAFFPVWASGCRLSAVIIAHSLTGECAFSHEGIGDGWKSICVKFGDCKPDRTGNMASLMHLK